jgi:hypothetical protein
MGGKVHVVCHGGSALANFLRVRGTGHRGTGNARRLPNGASTCLESTSPVIPNFLFQFSCLLRTPPPSRVTQPPFFLRACIPR